MKRLDVISWDDYFMGMAHLSAKRSKDPNTQVGACIVTPQKKVVGLGYNGFPTGISDDSFPWVVNADYEHSKYAYVVHAELNAILNSTSKLEDCTMYVSLFPCNECAKAIIQSGIKSLVYENDKYAKTPSVISSKRMLAQAGVQLIKLDHKIEVNISTQENYDE